MLTYCDPWPGVEECHLGRGAMAAEDALRAQRLPDRRLVGPSAFEGLGATCPPARRHRHSRSPCVRAHAGPIQPVRTSAGASARLGGLLDGAQTLGQLRLGSRADHQRAAQRRLGRCGVGSMRSLASSFAAWPVSPAGGISRAATECLPFPVSRCGNVFLQHGMKIGAAETERAHAGAPHAIRRRPSTVAVRC